MFGRARENTERARARADAQRSCVRLHRASRAQRENSLATIASARSASEAARDFRDRLPRGPAVATRETSAPSRPGRRNSTVYRNQPYIMRGLEDFKRTRGRSIPGILAWML